MTARPPADPSAPAGASRRAAVRHDAGAVRAGEETVADETPVALVYNGHPFAVMMATPADLADFARGFSLTEGVVERIDEILGVEIVEVARGREVRIAVVEARALALRARSRALAGRTGCGLCGVEQIAEALRPVARPASIARFSAAALRAAIAAFSGGQCLNAATGATHAAAFAAADGRILLLREDVGRHNAVDKLVGAMAAAGLRGGDGFFVVSSRCSYEMVHKTAAAGVPAIVSVSAPTGLAVDLAERLGVGLAAFAREDRFTVYAGESRFI
ncbi:MAG: formate dehydrogenase accessory sulfurtransferase FdhD [Hyphomicrobiales bacterium]|nr:formate dehydrogenase accessory sulfurtransferase FdhD [Hyphomicrobiales bacterium]